MEKRHEIVFRSIDNRKRAFWGMIETSLNDFTSVKEISKSGEEVNILEEAVETHHHHE